MKSSTKFLAVAAAAAGLALATAAIGQPGYGAGMGMGPGMGMGAGMGPGHGMGAGMGPGVGMGGRMGGGPGMMGPGGFDMAAASAGRLAAFKAQLKIAPDQESPWKAYESTMTQQAAAMQKQRDEFHAQWQNAKPGEATADMNAHRQAMSTLHQSHWEAQRKAMQDLYAVLTPEQQSLVTGGWGGGPRRR